MFSLVSDHFSVQNHTVHQIYENDIVKTKWESCTNIGFDKNELYRGYLEDYTAQLGTFKDILPSFCNLEIIHTFYIKMEKVST